MTSVSVSDWKWWPRAASSSFESPEVLDDAVVDDREPAGVAEMGMGVGLGDAAVGCPAGVAEADVGGREIDRGVGDLAGLLLHLDMAVDARCRRPRSRSRDIRGA